MGVLVMLSLDRIKKYVDTICQQIRWRKAHSRVSEEMINHIVDARDSYMAEGLDENAATEKAINETGDATNIGTQLDRIHRPKPQWGMFAATGVCLIIGLLIRMFVFTDEDRVGLMFVRLFYTGIGIAGMIIAYFTDFTVIGKYPKTIYFSVIAVSAAMILFSPSETGGTFYAQYIILLFPLAFTAIIYAARNKGYFGIVLCGLALVLLSFAALYLPSISGFLHFGIIGATILGIAIYKKWFGTKRVHSFLLMIAFAAALTIVFLVNIPPYGWNRLAVAFNPYSDPNGAGYMGVMVRKLLSSAVFWGRGNISGEYFVGVTEPYSIFYTDLIMTALISLLGWVTFAVIISALLFLILKGFMLCFKQKSSLGLFVSISIMMTFCMQVIVYVGYNLGFPFFAPISLPLISHGNTAMVINLVLIGFMLSVFRTGDVVTDGEIPPVKNHNRFLSWWNE